MDMDQALALALEFALALTLALDLAVAIDLALTLTLALVLALVLDLAVTSSNYHSDSRFRCIPRYNYRCRSGIHSCFTLTHTLI